MSKEEEVKLYIIYLYKIQNISDNYNNSDNNNINNNDSDKNSGSDNDESSYHQKDKYSKDDNTESKVGEKQKEKEKESDNSSPKIISVENADFTNKNKMINSPRSIRACKELGILPSELYKISLEEYKKKNPDSFSLNPKILQFRYDGQEKFRNESIALVKKRREGIINNSNKINNAKDSKNKNEYEKNLEKVKQEGKKAMDNLKNIQKKNIRSILEDQMNHEI